MDRRLPWPSDLQSSHSQTMRHWGSKLPRVCCRASAVSGPSIQVGPKASSVAFSSAARLRAVVRHRGTRSGTDSARRSSDVRQITTVADCHPRRARGLAPGGGFIPRSSRAPAPRRIRGSDYRWELQIFFTIAHHPLLDVGVIILIVDREATEEPLHLPLQGAARRRAVEMVVAPGKRK